MSWDNFVQHINAPRWCFKRHSRQTGSSEQDRSTNTGSQVLFFSLRSFKTQIHCTKKAFLRGPWTRYYAVGCKSAFNQRDKRKDQKCSIRSVQGKDIRKNCPGGGWKLCKNVKQENLLQATGKFICCWSLCCCKLILNSRKKLTLLSTWMPQSHRDAAKPQHGAINLQQSAGKALKTGAENADPFSFQKRHVPKRPLLSPSFTCCFSSGTPGFEQETKCEKKSLARAKQCSFCTWDSLVFHTSNKAFYFTLKQEHHFPNWEVHPAGCTNTAGIKFIKQGVHGAATWSVTELSTQPEVTALNFLC